MRMPSLVSSSTSKKRPSRSTMAATVTEGFQISDMVSFEIGCHFTAAMKGLQRIGSVGHLFSVNYDAALRRHSPYARFNSFLARNIRLSVKKTSQIFSLRLFHLILLA